MKHKVLIATGILFVALIVFFFISRRSGDVSKTLETQDSRLQELSGTLAKVEEGIPNIIQKTSDTQRHLAGFRGNVGQLRGQVASENFNTLSAAYEHAENGVSGSLTLIGSARLCLQSCRAALELLQENRAALRAGLIDKASDQDGVRARDKVTDGLKRTGDLLTVAERIAEDLGHFSLQQEEQWLNMHQQMKNLEAVSQGDAELKELTHTLTTLLEVEGASLENVRKLHAVCEDLPKKLRREADMQNGLLSIVK